MTEKIILITGTSSGFGKLTAQSLAKEGHQVFASMRGVEGKNKEQARFLTQWAKENDYKLTVVELDVISDHSVETAADTVLAITGGRLDVIINNAGIYGGGIQEVFTVNDHKTLFEVNVFGSVRVNNAFLPVLRKQKSGLIIQISSTLGRIVIPFGGVYDATKWAVEALSENLAYELKPFGIDVAIVQPGAFPTEIFQKFYYPSNSEVATEYGKSAELYSTVSQTISAMMADPNLPNKPEQVADAIVRLVDMPNGTRPLRTVVDKMMGGVTEIINETAKQVQAGVLQNFGLAELNTNN
jgi:NAD(P)-dependent dehydrogenase (short-subunit alcohol dehydrogenase family)